MTAIRSFASQIVAASAALALSIVLISGTVSNPVAPTATVVPEMMA